jgi:protein-disulfide isomerase
MKTRWETVLTTMLVGCALITTALVVRREFVSPATASVARKPVLVQNWKSHVGEGVRLGPSSAPVQLIEFADFECPFCGDFHKKIKMLRERYPAEVSLTYVHFPLQGHRFALSAARVAECAGDQGRFESMYDHLFDEQDALGLKSWSEYATEAGVTDLARFDSCIKDTRPVPRIEEGKQWGAKLDVNATPTLIVNGWMLGEPPTAEELDAMVKAVLAGKNPISAIHKS